VREPSVIRIIFILSCASVFCGCFAQHSVQVAPIHVEPIRVQMDVNVSVDSSGDGEEDAVASGDGPEGSLER
jgi:hypothetical protein